MSIRNGYLTVVCRLCIEAAVDLFTGGAVQIPDLETEASGLDKGLGEGSNANVVGLTLGGLDVVSAVCLDITHGDKVPEVVGMRLHPGTSK
jgi:hypothetical protein